MTHRCLKPGGPLWQPIKKHKPLLALSGTLTHSTRKENLPPSTWGMMTVMTVRRHFPEVNVAGHIDPAHPEALAIDVTIQAASIKTHNPSRDNDLRASNVLECPRMSSKWTHIRRGLRHDLQRKARWHVGRQRRGADFHRGEIVERKQEPSAG